MSLVSKKPVIQVPLWLKKFNVPTSPRWQAYEANPYDDGFAWKNHVDFFGNVFTDNAFTAFKINFFEKTVALIKSKGGEYITPAVALSMRFVAEDTIHFYFTTHDNVEPIFLDNMVESHWHDRGKLIVLGSSGVALLCKGFLTTQEEWAHFESSKKFMAAPVAPAEQVYRYILAYSNAPAVSQKQMRERIIYVPTPFAKLEYFETEPVGEKA